MELATRASSSWEVRALWELDQASRRRSTSVFANRNFHFRRATTMKPNGNKETMGLLHRMSADAKNLGVKRETNTTTNHRHPALPADQLSPPLTTS